MSTNAILILRTYRCLCKTDEVLMKVGASTVCLLYNGTVTYGYSTSLIRMNNVFLPYCTPNNIENLVGRLSALVETQAGLQIDSNGNHFFWRCPCPLCEELRGMTNFLMARVLEGVCKSNVAFSSTYPCLLLKSLCGLKVLHVQHR